MADNVEKEFQRFYRRDTAMILRCIRDNHRSRFS